MLDRLSKHNQESGTHPHNWAIPAFSPGRTRSRSSNEHIQVPSPSIFKDVAIPYALTNNSTAPPTFEQYPTPGHVASHLLLIECFQRLRQTVETSFELTALFRGRDISTCSTPSSKSATWMLYLELATRRFRLWITKIESVIRHAAVFNRYGTGSHLHGAFTEHYLPPVDVLFIWYSYLQSPTAYERLIASNEFRLLSQICFPWHVFPTCIDRTTLEYSTSHAARTLWTTLIGVPPNLSECVGHDLGNDAVAFMSAPAEMLDIALRQADFIESVARPQWLRSPALHGTLQRAMSTYVSRMIHTPNPGTTHTQQIPMDSLEARSVHELDLDLPAQLILHTHRAYHGAWRVFTQLNNLKDEDMPPPPPYDEVHNDTTGSQLGDPNMSDPCYCWICERVKDEIEADSDSPSMLLAPLRRVSSPEDEKRTISSDVSSELETSMTSLELPRKQIKAIKADIALYRHIESQRLKKTAI